MESFINNLNVNSLILDLFIIVVVLYNVIKSSKRGFISSFVSLIFTVLSFVLAIPASQFISQNIYNLYLRNLISKYIESRIADKGLPDFSILKNILNDKLPKISNYFNYDINGVNDMIENVDSINEIGNFISDKFVYPLLNIFMCMIILIVISFIFSILIKLLSKFFSLFSCIPVVGKLNIFLGSVFGFFKALAIVSFVFVIFNTIVSISNDNLSFFNSEIKEQTLIFKYIYKFVNENKIFNF